MSKRKFSKEEKITIIQEASTNGVTATLGKYDVYPATYYNWKRKLQEQGEEGFRKGITSAQVKEIRALEKENRQLKELVAEKELFIRALKEARVKKG